VVIQSDSWRAKELSRMPDTARSERFEREALPHLDAAYNLARWLMRNDKDAQDVTQEACLRAFRIFDGYQGGNMRTWFLTIVRNTCYTWLHKYPRADSTELFNEEIHGPEFPGNSDPEIHVLVNADRETLNRALEELPDLFREALVLRELEGMSYKEIADITSSSMGTVMSRLARARTQLRQALSVELSRGY
jgi:RNA polymerase sigma-70 factor (ECF subfamily)